jgi:L-lactate transport
MLEQSWDQNYTPVAGSLLWSSCLAATPVAVLLYAIGIRRVTAWKASLAGLAAALLVAISIYRMPPLLAADSALYGAAFGIFPIFWIVYWAIFLYRVTVDTGKFEIIRDSIGHLTTDRNLQALLIAFAFGAFLEGAAGFGTPVAIAATILAGLGFSAFNAAGICLLANTAPVAFGSIGIPLVTLAATTGLPIDRLSQDVGRLCAPLSLLIPGYLVLVLSGRKGLRHVWPAALVCGGSYAGVQFLVSYFLGPYLTDILSSLTAIAALVALLLVWRPAGEPALPRRFQTGQIIRAWSPYLFLIAFILVWSFPNVKRFLDEASLTLPWPGLHNAIRQLPPVVAHPTLYAASYRLRIFAESGTACAFAGVVTAFFLGLSIRRMWELAIESARQLRSPFISITAVLALAFVMNYSGATATLGLAFSATGKAYPFFAAVLGWLGVFLTGSDTSSNALFGNMQQIAARRLGLDAALMASVNSAGGVMGKMISLQSIAVAAAAAGLPNSDEPKLFRFTLKHSVFLMSLIGLLALVYAYDS